MYSWYNLVRSLSLIFLTDFSKNKYSPSVKLSSIPIQFNKVDFPEPEGPISDINSPSFTCKLMSFSNLNVFPPDFIILEAFCISNNFIILFLLCS